MYMVRRIRVKVYCVSAGLLNARCFRQEEEYYVDNNATSFSSLSSTPDRVFVDIRSA